MSTTLETVYGSQPQEEIVLPPSNDEPELGIRAVLRTYPIEIPPRILSATRAELEAGREFGVDSLNPSFETQLDKFPQAMNLARFIAEELLDVQGSDITFIRSVQQQANVFVGNLHHDWKYVGYNEKTGQSGSVFRQSPDTEIWRQIINFGPTARHLQLVDSPLQSFVDQGVGTDKIRPDGIEVGNAHKIDEVDSDLIAPAVLGGNSKIFSIPAYDGSHLPVFEFWASRVLHAGITEAEGHFMAAAARRKETGQPDIKN